MVLDIYIYRYGAIIQITFSFASIILEFMGYCFHLCYVLSNVAIILVFDMHEAIQ